MCVEAYHICMQVTGALYKLRGKNSTTLCKRNIGFFSWSYATILISVSSLLQFNRTQSTISYSIYDSFLIQKKILDHWTGIEGAKNQSLNLYPETNGNWFLSASRGRAFKGIHYYYREKSSNVSYANNSEVMIILKPQCKVSRKKYRLKQWWWAANSSSRRTTRTSKVCSI